MLKNNIFYAKILFCLQAIVIGAWFPRIPQVKDVLELNPSELALCLMGAPIGSMLALVLGGVISERLGTKRLLLFGIGIYLLAVPLPFAALGELYLFFALFLMGVCTAFSSLSLNVFASSIEKNHDVVIMNSCHGFWSLGVLLGSAIGSGLAEIGVALMPSALLVSGLLIIPILWAISNVSNYDILRENTGKNEGRKQDLRHMLPVIGIAVFAFGFSTVEGAIADWVAIFMTDVHALSPGLAGVSYTAFALFVAAGRMGGDSLKKRYSTVLIARCMLLMALVGLILFVVSPAAIYAYLGIAALGLGVSLGFPLAVSAAGQAPGRSSAANMSIVTQFGICGFLIGPPMIGFMSHQFDFRIGLAMLLPPLLISFLAAGFLKIVPGSTQK